MPFTAQNLEEKPYNLCLNCVNIGKNCDGPNFIAMPMERWCEWCKLRKEYLGWTNERVAETANISLISVKRVMSGNVKDLRISTMHAITKALVTVDGEWVRRPCAAANEAEILYRDSPELVARFGECQRQIEQYEERIAFFRSQIAVKDKYLEEKDRQLAEKDKQLADQNSFGRRKNRILEVLSVALAVAILAIIFGLYWGLK